MMGPSDVANCLASGELALAETAGVWMEKDVPAIVVLAMSLNIITAT